MELKDLAKMTVVKLREEAHKFEDIKGAIGMTKEQLIDVLCTKYNIVKKKELPKGIGRHALKEKIRKMAAQRDAILSAGDSKKTTIYRRRIKSLRRRLRKVIEQAAHGKVKASKSEGAPAQ